MVDHAVNPWAVKVPKLLSVLNPNYGDFIETCDDIYALCRRDKALGRNTLDCGLDRARMFIDVGLGTKLHCKLIII